MTNAILSCEPQAATLLDLGAAAQWKKVFQLTVHTDSRCARWCPGLLIEVLAWVKSLQRCQDISAHGDAPALWPFVPATCTAFGERRSLWPKYL